MAIIAPERSKGSFQIRFKVISNLVFGRKRRSASGVGSWILSAPLEALG